jgi:hypothetical protein
MHKATPWFSSPVCCALFLHMLPVLALAQSLGSRNASATQELAWGVGLGYGGVGISPREMKRNGDFVPRNSRSHIWNVKVATQVPKTANSTARGRYFLSRAVLRVLWPVRGKCAGQMVERAFEETLQTVPHGSLLQPWYIARAIVHFGYRPLCIRGLLHRKYMICKGLWPICA